jgi:hypothetical protein
MMSSRFLGAFVAALLMTSFGRVASADPLLSPGSVIRLYDSYGSTGGGEFNGQVVGTSAAIDFISFCLEINEYFSPGQNLLVKDVSTEARNGGAGGPSPDPISYATAYLFTEFALQTLTGYDFGSGAARLASANSLQRAIWYLEQEIPMGQLDAQALAWVNQATAAGWTDVGNVRVLNLLRQDLTGAYTLNAQDQLYLQSVPEPASLALFGVGLAALAAVRARARARASRTESPAAPPSGRNSSL